jgi:IstB-like ATP binding protein
MSSSTPTRPGPARPTSRSRSIKACQAGHRVAFATAQQWVTRLEAAQDRNNLDDELRRLERYRLLVVDLCRYRDYADIVAAAGLNAGRSLGFSPVTPASLSA